MSRAFPVARYAPIVGRRAWLADRSNGERLHAGIDLAAPPGTVVASPEAGEVIVVEAAANETRRWAGYGPAVVVVRGASGAFHRLTHLASTGIRVAVGDLLQSPGVPIALISSLAHLHWEVMARPSRTNPFATVELCADPVEWVQGRWVQYDAATMRRPSAPGPTTKTPRAFRTGYVGPMSPAPGPPGGGPGPSAATFRAVYREVNNDGSTTEILDYT